MERGDWGTSPVRVVRAFLESLEGRTPTRAEVRRIRGELQELYDRVERVRRMAPELSAIDLGDDVKKLWKILRSGGGLRNAASFL